MKHIEIAMEKLNLDQEVNSEHISIVEQILRQTRNPKIAAVLALDLMLVGVDTVRCFYSILGMLFRNRRRKLISRKLFSLHNQTSVAASSTMYQLSQNEDKQEKLFTELKRALNDKDSRLTPSTLEQLPYLKACIKETLRMYPVVLGNGRSLQSDAIISGYHVPKGVSEDESFWFIQQEIQFRFRFHRLMWFSRTTFCQTRRITSRNQRNLFPSDGWRTMSNRRKTFIDSSVCHSATVEERASEGASPRRNFQFYCQRQYQLSLIISRTFFSHKNFSHRFSASITLSTIMVWWITALVQRTSLTSH